MNKHERLEKLNAEQRQLLIEQLSSRNVLKQKQGRTKLVAVVSGCDSTLEQSLNEHLGNILPDYMLPNQWHFLNSLPRNANGKLDRQALMRLVTTQVFSRPDGKAYLRASSMEPDAESDSSMKDMEQTLASIWAEVLFMDEVQADDDYFELGGDSIASMQIVARAGKQGLDFSTQDIMHFPSIRRLCERIVALRHNNDDTTQTIVEQDTESVADVMRVLNLGDQ